MTCDATAPITAPELEFLELASAEVNSVLIAVTKIDKNFRHWQSIIDENRSLLRQYAPRFADVPILGMSSMAAFSAIKMEPGDGARRHFAHRGCPPSSSTCTGCAPRATHFSRPTDYERHGPDSSG